MMPTVSFRQAFLILLLSAVCLLSQSVYAAKGDDILWKSGLNLVIKYDRQDTKDFGANDHPVSLEESAITNALESLSYEDKSLITGKVDIEPVFSFRQAGLLGEYLSKGLENARPDQDIVFVIQSSSRKLLILTERAFVAGRAFYKNGKLNLILGDYDRARNEAFEAVYDPSGKGNIPYTFNHGYRGKTASGFKDELVDIPGVTNKVVGTEQRKNWFEIDVNKASQAWVAKKKGEEQLESGVNSAAMQREAEKLAQERRQLRLEMAKMRKEMEEGGAVSSGGLSIEDRLLRLEQLKEKGLITEDEYQAKRREVLEDI